MVDAVVEFVGDRTASVVVHHVDNHDDADELGATLTSRLPQLGSLSVSDMGPVLSVHVGGGAIGVAVTVDDK
jgi:fatty acid-binding protein DegV